MKYLKFYYIQSLFYTILNSNTESSTNKRTHSDAHAQFIDCVSAYRCKLLSKHAGFSIADENNITQYMIILHMFLTN